MFCALVAAEATAEATRVLETVARGASPRVEGLGFGVVACDVRGVKRLFGDAAEVAALCRGQAADRGVVAAVAVAATRTAALLAALLPGATVAAIAPGTEAAAVAPLPLAVLDRLVRLEADAAARARPARRTPAAADAAGVPLETWKRWGLATLGALAALPSADLFERQGAAGLAWQAMARGTDARPLAPTAEPHPFAATVAFEWPIEAIEPLSFALGSLVDPLCARLDRGGHGTVTLQTTLRLVTRALHVRRLGLPMPMRDPRVLRTLIVLDLESHPPPAGIDALTVTFEPVAARVVQPSLLARAHPRPETIATLTARLRAVMGDGRVGTPIAVDSHRGGAMAMRPFVGLDEGGRGVAGLPLAIAEEPETPATSAPVVALTLRRFRQPPRVRVDLERGRPTRVRPLEPGRLPRLAFLRGRGVVRQAAGPWRTSGDWWRVEAGEPGPEAKAPEARVAGERPAAWRARAWRPEADAWSHEPASPWDDDEWDVVLDSGCALRLARDRAGDTWVVAAVVD